MDCQKSDVPLSNKKICLSCSMKRVKKTAKSMMDRKGKAYEKWKEGILNYINKED